MLFLMFRCTVFVREKARKGTQTPDTEKEIVERTGKEVNKICYSNYQ